ncbi:unnamed protein product [Lactuca saligna]|uniref:Uncharacterized protein n=1 Tax=Lactuca saligna TaxID=75948 RepID=A0AA35Z6P1_LACSI|nr:unnamed protein product [Lactuca saligna]
MQRNLSHRFSVVLIHHLQALNLPQSPIHHRQIKFLLLRVFVSDEIFKDPENGKFDNQHCIYPSHHVINKVREEFIKNMVLAKALLLTYDNVCTYVPFHRLAPPPSSPHPLLPLSSLLTLMGAYREEPDYTMLSNLISVSSKVARIVADADNTLLDNIKMFFINLFQYSADCLLGFLFMVYNLVVQAHGHDNLLHSDVDVVFNNIGELNLVFNFCKGAFIKSLESGPYGNVTGV